MPEKLKLYLPALLDSTDETYSLEYLYLLPLSDLFVFSEIDVERWNSIFKSLSDVLGDFNKYDCNEEIKFYDTDSLYLYKTQKRLDSFFAENEEIYYQFTDGGKGLSLRDIACHVSEYIEPFVRDDFSVIHGDFCFSNLLFDNRSELIKCIDPRGLDESGRLSVYGDRRYDFAKLYHSVIGYYDLIIAGRFTVEGTTLKPTISFDVSQNKYQAIEDCFRKHVLEPSKYKEVEILAITINLFISMLPLHSDRPERQIAFIANALRLYRNFLELTT
jgi:hypothetical protein